jgi:hypothetical protein
MSPNTAPVFHRNSVFGSRATSSNTGWYLFLLAVLLFATAEYSFADKLGVELLSSTIAATTTTQDWETPVDEIVVVGIRAEDGTVRPRRLLSDPLLQHILHDFEMREELEREFAGRLESADADDDSPDVRIGYDLGEQDREPERKQSLELPLDLIRPAIVISLDF